MNNQAASPSTDQFAPGREFSLPELATALIKYFDLHEGRYQIAVKFQIGAGAVQALPPTGHPQPGVTIAIDGVALRQATDSEVSQNIVDAAIVNPRKDSASVEK